MLRAFTIVLSLAITAGLWGCLASETMVLEYDMVRDGHRGAPIDVSAGAFGQADVDLERVRIYEENRGDIERVDRLGFEAQLANAGGTPATLDLYLSSIDSLTDPAGEATLLVPDLPVPATEGRLTYRDSEGLIQNLETFRAAVDDGTFTLYYVTDAESPVTVAEMKMIVTFTVTY